MIHAIIARSEIEMPILKSTSIGEMRTLHGFRPFGDGRDEARVRYTEDESGRRCYVGEQTAFSFESIADAMKRFSLGIE